MKEQTVQQGIRLALSQNGCRVFRNNCGALKDRDGRLVRYGVANPGGSDLLGWKSIEITPEMVGRKVAVFLAIECKGERGRATAEQINFIERVKEAGGLAGIARTPDDAIGITDPL